MRQSVIPFKKRNQYITKQPCPLYTHLPNQAILQYSRTTKFQILACPDGSGITVNENRMTFIGNVLMFSRGKKVEILQCPKENYVHSMKRQVNKRREVFWAILEKI